MLIRTGLKAPWLPQCVAVTQSCSVHMHGDNKTRLLSSWWSGGWYRNYAVRLATICWLIKLQGQTRFL